MHTQPNDPNQISSDEQFLMDIRSHLQATIDEQWGEPKEDIRVELEGIIDLISDYLNLRDPKTAKRFFAAL